MSKEEDEQVAGHTELKLTQKKLEADSKELFTFNEFDDLDMLFKNNPKLGDEEYEFVRGLMYPMEKKDDDGKKGEGD